MNGPPNFVTGNESRLAQYINVLQNRRQLDRKWMRQLAHGKVRMAGQAKEDGAARRVGERRKGLAQSIVQILYHLGKYL